MYLLDTHILLWWLMAPKQLTKTQFSTIENERNEIYVSVASLWEIAIKGSLKTLKIPLSFKEELEKLRFKILPIDFETVWIVKDLAFYHTDPFDRLIIAAAQSHQLTVITQDEVFQQYKVKLLH